MNIKNKRKNFLLFVLAVAAMASVAIIYAAEDGGQDASAAPTGIAISTPQQLAQIGITANYPLNGNYYLAIDLDLADIDTNGSVPGNFTPIGSSTSPFTGTFNGNGHKISGLNVYVYNPSGDACAGLFGYVQGARIFDLGITESSIMASSLSHTAFAGGIVGEVLTDASSSTLMATFTNCYNTGAVSAETNEGKAFAGGIFGGIYCPSGVSALSTTITLTGCYNTGLITISASTGSDTVCAGGMFGGIQSQGDTAPSLTTIAVSKCFNTGSIEIHSSGNNAAAGGIAGTVNGRYSSASSSTIISFMNCYNKGSEKEPVKESVTITSANGTAYLGGIIGSLVIDEGTASSIFTSFTNCYSTGALQGYGTKGTYAGGIVGAAENNRNTGTSAIETAITNCYFQKGKITIGSSPGADILCGYVQTGTTFIVDGKDNGTPRAGTQGSGAKTSSGMTPNLTNAKNGKAVYFIGITLVGSKDVNGWDFSKVWNVSTG